MNIFTKRPPGKGHLILLASALAILSACQVGIAYVPDSNNNNSPPLSDAGIYPQVDAAPVGPDGTPPVGPDAAPPMPDATVADAYVPPEPDAAAPTWTAPDFTLEDINPQSSSNGQDVTVSSHLGQVVVLYFGSFT